MNRLGSKMFPIFIEIKELAKVLGISRRAIQKWINKGKIHPDFIKKKSSKGRSGFKYKINPRGIPEPYRSNYFKEYESSTGELKISKLVIVVSTEEGEEIDIELNVNQLRGFII